MKSTFPVFATIASIGCLGLSSCALDEFFESKVEQYTHAFIKEFGLVDPEQDWTMARSAEVTLNIGPNASSVKIYGKYEGSYYKVADLQNVGGTLTVPVQVPKKCDEVMVRVDGRTYYGNIGTPVSCSGAASRGIPDGNYDASGNPSSPVFTKTAGDYKIEVRHTQSGNDATGAYQIFNTQQMAPLVSPDVWSDYFSLNTNTTAHNTSGSIGLLPESGVYNAPKEYLDNILRNSIQDVAVDFSVDAGDNGAFTLFPFYYGTNLIHELGVYLLDDAGRPATTDGGPVNADRSNLITLPIFIDKDPGDLQVQPHYCSDIKYIKAYDSSWHEITHDNPLCLNEGDTHQLIIQLYDESWNTIDYDETFKSKYHSRIAYHAWIDSDRNSDGTVKHPRRFGKQFVSCDNDGVITAFIDTHGYDDEEMYDGKCYMQVAIATSLDGNFVNGVEYNFPVVVTDPDNSGNTSGDDNDDNQDPDYPGIKDQVFVPDGVDRTWGAVYQGSKVTMAADNIVTIPGITDLWGVTGTGVQSDDYAHCLYERDDYGNLKKDKWGNVFLAPGKVKLLYEDIEQAFNNNTFTLTGLWGSATVSSSEYMITGLDFLNANSNENWLQFDIYVQPRDQTYYMKSRTDIPADATSFLTDRGNWKDVNRAWSRYLPDGKEVASYPVDMPMLARTRGYDVAITNADGSPYRGKFGMYITIKAENNYNDGNYVTTYRNESDCYTLYSQTELNTHGQRSAAAFRHPVSGRTFFTFEDMDLTHPGPGETGGYDYGEYEQSSDRDINDLVFMLRGYNSISGGDKEITETEEVVEEGFSWIWALEDMGSTGDFDFNDVVIRVGDITTTTITTVTDGDGNVSSTGSAIVRKLSFQPLAAGGKLPVHIHLNYDGKDYTLAPGAYDLTKDESPRGMEFHEWFGNGMHCDFMINTGASAHITTDARHSCEITVDPAKLPAGAALFTAGDGKTNGLLYVVVQGDGNETWSEMQAIDNERLTSDDDAYLVPLPEKGKATQSFFIVEKDGSHWSWPREYTHIKLAYPNFADWIKDPSVDWTSSSDPDLIYNR